MAKKFDQHGDTRLRPQRQPISPQSDSPPACPWECPRLEKGTAEKPPPVCPWGCQQWRWPPASRLSCLPVTACPSLLPRPVCPSWPSRVLLSRAFPRSACRFSLGPLLVLLQCLPVFHLPPSAPTGHGFPETQQLPCPPSRLPVGMAPPSLLPSLSFFLSFSGEPFASVLVAVVPFFSSHPHRYVLLFLLSRLPAFSGQLSRMRPFSVRKSPPSPDPAFPDALSPT